MVLQRRRHRSSGWLIYSEAACLLILLITPSLALAEPDADPDSEITRDRLVMEEIIVTAERRETSIQDVTMSIRALSAQELDRLGADNLQSYAAFTPGVQLIEQGAARSQINMRGVTTGDLRRDRSQFNESVGLYLDESSIATQIVNPNLMLFDMNRIEVLRGPQPTLYGAGSLSGTVRMITNKPEATRFYGLTRLSVFDTSSGDGSTTADAMINIPLVEDTLALRVVGFYRGLGGYIDDIERDDDNINSTSNKGGRASLRYTPNEKLLIDAGFVYQDNREDGTPEYRPVFGDLNTNIGGDGTYLLKGDTKLASLVIEYDLPFALLTSASSWYKKYTQSDEKTEFIEVFLGIHSPEEGFSTFYDDDQFTQEVRLTSSSDSSFQWVLGAFFQRKDREFGQRLVSPGFDDAIGIPSEIFLSPPDTAYWSDVMLKTDQFAVYAEGTYRFTDQWSLAMGARYFDADQDSTTFYSGVFAAPVGTYPAEYSDNGLNPRFVLSYEINTDKMIYAQAAKGFRLGGINEPIPSNCDTTPFGIDEPPESFDSDSLWNYELGLKSTWSDGRLQVNAAAYVIDWTDPPVSADYACGFGSIINAGSFQILGAEADVQALLTEGLVFTMGLAFTDSKLGDDVLALGGLEGDPTPFTPDFAGSIALDYDWSLTGGWSAFIHGDYRYVGERWTNFPGAISTQGAFLMPSYTVGNIRGGLYNEKWQLELFVTNVGDERARLNQTARVFFVEPAVGVVTIRPRTIGAQITVGF